jgi:hypothetical protein
MLENNLQDKELLLRKHAAKGEFEKVQEILDRNRNKCRKITSPSELEGETAIAAGFYSIIDGLKLIEFFPKKEHGDTFTILSLACGISTEILPLIALF